MAGEREHLPRQSERLSAFLCHVGGQRPTAELVSQERAQQRTLYKRPIFANLVIRSSPPDAFLPARAKSGPELASFASGVGKNEDTLPLVRGANGGSGKSDPLRVIPEVGKVPDHTPGSPESRSVGSVRLSQQSRS